MMITSMGMTECGHSTKKIDDSRKGMYVKIGSIGCEKVGRINFQISQLQWEWVGWGSNGMYVTLL